MQFVVRWTDFWVRYYCHYDDGPSYTVSVHTGVNLSPINILHTPKQPEPRFFICHTYYKDLWESRIPLPWRQGNWRHNVVHGRVWDILHNTWYVMVHYSMYYMTRNLYPAAIASFCQKFAFPLALHFVSHLVWVRLGNLALSCIWPSWPMFPRPARSPSRANNAATSSSLAE